MRKSDRYELNLVEGSDIVNPLVQDVPNYERIDEEMGKNADAGVPLATELLSGTVHALTRENPNAPMFRFVATANYKSGDTFTVDGVQVTALLTSGEPLATGCYVINSNVLCCLVGTVLTMFWANSLAEIHAVDSDKLGGEDAKYYASANSVVEAINLAQNANQISLANREDINEQNKNLGGLRFGVDGEGNGGYFKADDSFVPFKSLQSEYVAIKKINNTSIKDNISISGFEIGKLAIVYTTPIATGSANVASISGMDIIHHENVSLGGGDYQLFIGICTSTTISITASGYKNYSVRFAGYLK